MIAESSAPYPKPLPEQEKKHFIHTAISLGATEAVIIPSGLIVVDDDLARLCNGKPVCPNYGLSPSCPPHVPGPPAFRTWCNESPWCVVIRMDFPPVGQLSQDHRDLGRLLHDIVAGVEHEAVQSGHKRARAFAGGSCKHLFCYEFDACRVLSVNGPCRNPESARPSMSGFGINVAKLMASAQWEEPPDPKSMSWLAGIVLV
jgi:predicted metal-binding protein